MNNFMGVGTFWIGLNRADLGCWRLILIMPSCIPNEMSIFFFKCPSFPFFVHTKYHVLVDLLPFLTES